MGQGKISQQEIVSLDSWKFICEYLLYRCGFDEGLEPILPYRGFMLKKDKNWKIFGSECIVGKNGCALMGDGTVYPCRRFNLPIGNLIEQKFIDIWAHSFVSSLRKRKNLKGKCKTCKVEKCYGCRALTHCLTRDFYQQDPLCFL
ncbi:MAG: SPASM domain-containing protein [Candidatus Omnitrophica bacterium]|nr:SPASM domain-containing protein [Candidatus Omnitrophota bacterium]